ncbi:MAG: cation diffusion facilitator family transporter [Acidobacteriota bacterium]
MSAGHDHAHTHGHGHDGASFGRAFAIGIALNLAFVVVELVYGVLAHSLALVADAGHNVSDVLGLALAWGATMAARRRPSKRRTYGLKRASILAALFNALTLLLVTGGVAWESIRRFLEPAPVAGKDVMVVAAVGVLVNGVAAGLFLSGRKEDLNIRAAFLHLASDAVASLGVAITGAAIMATGRLWLDPAASLVLSAFILASSWSLLRRAMDLALDAVPENIDLDDVRAFLKSRPSVADVHDLHVWAMSTTETLLTAHLVVSDLHGDDMVARISEELRDRFHIGHATIQVERATPDDPCALAQEHP